MNFSHRYTQINTDNNLENLDIYQFKADSHSLNELQNISHFNLRPGGESNLRERGYPRVSVSICGSKS